MKSLPFLRLAAPAVTLCGLLRPSVGQRDYRECGQCVQLLLVASTFDFDLTRRERHSWGRGVPHELDVFGGQAVGGVDKVRQLVFEGERLQGGVAGRLHGLDVLLSQALDVGGAQALALGQSLSNGSDEGVCVKIVRCH